MMLHADTAYCPHCRTVTNLHMSISLRSISGTDGNTEMIVSKTYHCESCCSFVRSEDEEEIDKLRLRIYELRRVR